MFPTPRNRTQTSPLRTKAARSAMRQGICALSLALLLALLGSCGRGDQMLIIMHTNDIHAWFAPRAGRLADGQEVALGGAPVLAGLIRAYRASNPGTTLYLDGGDLFQGTPISNLSKGQGCIEVMNLLAPDAFVLGNHEFDYGMEDQRRAFDQATFPFLQANVRMIGRPHPYAQADMSFNRGGLKVSVLGLNTDELFQVCDPRRLAGVRVDSSHAVAAAWLKRVADSDVKVCLSHRGFRADSLLALIVPGFDYIVGGHSHTVLERPIKVGGTWIVQAGDQGRYLGVDTLWVRKGKGVSRISGGLVPVVEGAAEPALDVVQVVKAQEQQVNEQLGAQVAVLGGDWRRDSRGESSIGNWLCAAIRQEAKADVGLWNSGGIRKDLPAGPVTMRDIWEISPFGNEVVVVPRTGAQLRRLFQHELDSHGQHMQFDGLRVGVDEEGGMGVIMVGKSPMDEGRSYRVAMTDYVWGQVREEVDSLVLPASTGRLDRDVLIARARAEREIRPLLDQRWGPGDARNKVRVER